MVSAPIAGVFDVREIFDPGRAESDASPAQGWNPHSILQLTRDFYRHRMAWAALIIFALILVYVGGAAMFWYHSILLGEGGPAISPWLHWFVDSTAGVFALTPALAVILPVATRHAVRYTGRLRTAYFAIAAGVLFALATVPGPVLHDNFVGRGTWVADKLTAMWGNGQPLGPTHHYEAPVSMSLQLAFGIPVYILLMWLALLAVRGLFRRNAARFERWSTVESASQR